MPLTNVWTRDKKGEWVRTTAEETSRKYAYGVSSYSQQFRCYSCFQYVTFVSGTSKVVCHFRHSSHYADKDCEDRSKNLYGSQYSGLTDIAQPVRISILNRRLYFEIGMLPLNKAMLDRVVLNNTRITLTDVSGQSAVYRVDYSRFMPNTTTWLPMPSSHISTLKIDIASSVRIPLVWDKAIREVKTVRALFDANTGRMIPDRGDAVVNRQYYFILSREEWLGYFPSGVEIINLDKEIDDRQWRVYKIRALQLTEDSSEFFFERLHVRLTSTPAEISTIWPPLIERDNIIETNCRNLRLLSKGEADFCIYPSGSAHFLKTAVTDKIYIYSLDSDYRYLQMVSSERYGHTLQFLYLRQLERNFNRPHPQIHITDDNGLPFEIDQIHIMPIRGILHFSASDDGYVDVYENEDFLYRKPLRSEEKTRISDLKQGMELRLWIGCEKISVISFPRKKVAHKQIASGDSRAFSIGSLIPFDRRYAWFLQELDPDSSIYQHTLTALQKGQISINGWNLLRKIIGGK